MVKTLLIYKSKYKATKESVKKLAKILGPARCIECNEFDKDCEKYDFYVMVSPIYYEEIDKELKDFLVKKKDFFKNKKVAALSFSMSDGFYDRYLKIYKDILGDSLVYYNNFGSVINVEKLDKTDYESLEKFYEKMSMPLKDKDTRDDLKLALSGLEIKRIKDDLELKCKRKDILYEVEDYLRRHNTCTLCTASSIGVRGTPIEYNYFNKSLYFISEGGEKFANILLNKNVSVTLYDNYVGFNNINGMQIKANAEILEEFSEEYKLALKHKGLDKKNIMNLSCAMNIVKVKIEKIEFLSSTFKKYPGSYKQVLYF